MKALVFHCHGKLALEDRPVPVIEAPTDAIVRITKMATYGTGLHIRKVCAKHPH